MKESPRFLKLVMLAMMVAIGVVISPILRIEGMCPMAHLINIVCAVFLGPGYAFACAFTIGILRMTLMGHSSAGAHRRHFRGRTLGDFVPPFRRQADFCRHR